ncbi:MAG: class E sortase [Actinomycetales bacterium]|nr:class E sortase [Actinomycetales bacterium]
MSEFLGDSPLNPPTIKKVNYSLVACAVIFAVLVVEFGLSALVQQRSQHQLLAEFRSNVSQATSAIGKQDVSPLPDTAPAYGSPVALIQIPKLGLTQVVVEGSASNFTQLGPAHVPGTVLPGQTGESVIIGRRTTFGAPFFNIPKLKSGDLIKVITVEGSATYKVVSAKVATAVTGANTLKLVTSNPPILATGSTTVTAQLQAKPYPDTPKNARTAPSFGQFAWLILILQALLLVIYLSRGIYRKFGPVIGWLLLAPLLGGAIVALTLTLDTLVPATL